MVRLGGHGLPVGSDDVPALARAHVAFGYGAAYCPPVAIGDTSRLALIEKAFAAEDVTIAEVGPPEGPHLYFLRPLARCRPCRPT